VDFASRVTGNDVGREFSFRYKVLAFVRTNYARTVVDLGCTLNPATVKVLAEIDDIFLVTTLEVPSLHHAKLAIRTMIDAGLGTRLHVILNRTPQRPDVTPDELERMLGLPIDTSLPNDYYALYDAFCKGKLLPAGSHLATELSNLPCAWPVCQRRRAASAGSACSGKKAHRAMNAELDSRR
jgi:Flp pilus assembly CpaE family ATPase